MKVQLETIPSERPSSFQMMYNPRLSDLFFWHFHPEYELVYITGTNGTRHVGDHISTYEGSDLVLIGSNIPHLNFDYGVKSDYRKVVVHFKPKWIEKHLFQVPELHSVVRLFKIAQHGVAFSGTLKDEIGEQLFHFQELSPFEQYLELLSILQKMSEIEEYELLHEYPYTNQFSAKEQERLRIIYGYIDKHYHKKIDLKSVAALSNMTKEAFCRYFKKVTGNTFITFLNQYRISQAKRILMNGGSVSDACYESGFESLSYFNRVFKKWGGEQPSVFRKRYVFRNE